MSYIFIHSPLYEDIIHYIYRFNKIPDRLRNSPTSNIIKPIFTIREYIQNNTIEHIIICTLYSKLPILWLLNTLTKHGWDEHVKYTIMYNYV